VEGDTGAAYTTVKAIQRRPKKIALNFILVLFSGKQVAKILFFSNKNI
jgi:hypothetical protein